jgi:hypothetical protein
MVKALLWCALVACTVTAWTGAWRPAGADEIERHQAEPAVVVSQPLLAAIEAWLALHFDLPSVDHHPRIELVPPAKIAALRYHGLFPNPTTESAPNDHSSAASRSDVVAVYSDVTQTIYLPEGWTGTTAAELSILVHESITFRTRVGSSTHARRSAKSSPTWRKSDGSVCSGEISKQTSSSMRFPSW